jgi:hypothetical protein
MESPKADPKRPVCPPDNPTSRRLALPLEQVRRTVEVPASNSRPEYLDPLDKAPVVVHDQDQMALPVSKPSSLASGYRSPAGTAAVRSRGK